MPFVHLRPFETCCVFCAHVDPDERFTVRLRDALGLLEIWRFRSKQTSLPAAAPVPRFGLPVPAAVLVTCVLAWAWNSHSEHQQLAPRVPAVIATSTLVATRPISTEQHPDLGRSSWTPASGNGPCLHHRRLSAAPEGRALHALRPRPPTTGGGGTGGTSRGRRALRGGAPSRRHHWDLTGPRSPRLRPATHTGALASAGQSPGRLFHLPGAVRGPSGALCRSGLLSAKVTDGGGGGGEAPGPFQWAWASRPARGTHLRTLWEAHPAFKFVIKTTSDRPHHATLNTPEPI